jgi:hypothetical protein
MSTGEKEQQDVQNASGEFEYKWEDGGVVNPVYKYVYLEEGTQPILPVFVGRDTPNGIRETGFRFSFETLNFWGVNVPVGQGYTVWSFASGSNQEVLSGFITGMINPSEKSGFFKFNLTVNTSRGIKTVQGSFILRQDRAAL